ncbi:MULTISPECIES: nitric oxide reductase activation protein NorD [Mesorhizobium]|nr:MULTISPECIES: VWA domain-containing protein [Mesorhizobium]
METGAFPTDWQERWRVAHERIDHAGYGVGVAQAYRRAGPILAEHAGPALAVRLGSTISTVAIRGGRRSAQLLVDAALQLARNADDPAQLRLWLDLVEDVAKRAPESIAHWLTHHEQLWKTLGFEGMVAFTRMGLAISRDDRERRRAFFSLVSAEARKLLEQRADAASFPGLLPALKPYLAALWNIAPPIAQTPIDAPEIMKRRAGFGGGGIRLPSSFTGFSDEDQKLLFRASLAHIGAHHRFTRTRFPATGLKPLQLAIVSLIEDARVERLAIGEMPGLFDLWKRFHSARPEGTPIAISLMARLSRALLDPSYEDTHGFVEKGRTLFEEAVAANIGDQQLSRRIGGLLGNDIGQMRLQFDAKTYVVQPAYRDDNLAIWDFGDQSEQAIEIEAMVEGARLEQQDAEDGRREEGAGAEKQAGSVHEASSDEGIFVARYPEYDYVTGQLRPDWCTVREFPARHSAGASASALAQSRSDLVDKIAAMIRASRVSRQERIRHQPEGEFLDIDACIAAMVAWRAGEPPDTRIYGRYERRARDMSVLVLLDTSYSTRDRVRATDVSVLDTEKLATALLARAMTEVGDPFAIAAFCSDTREDVRYLRIKDFERSFDEYALGRLAGLESALSTRLGAVIRHAGHDLKRRSSYRRLLLVVTDGEPSDIDVDDRKYLVEDARAAVHELNRDGIDVFGVTLDSDAESYAQRIFGRRGSVQVRSINRLPDVLPMIYLRLAS